MYYFSRMNKDNNINEVNEFRCPRCHYVFINKFYLKKHILKNHPIHTNVCKFCGLKIKNKKHFKRHENLHLKKNNKNIFKCHKCCKVYNRNSHLIRHLENHNEIKSFICKICGHIFTRKDSLSRHFKNYHVIVINIIIFT